MKNITLTKPERENTAETSLKPLVRADLLARHFDVHKRTIQLWAERGDIPCVRIGGALRFDLEAVLAVVKGGTRA